MSGLFIGLLNLSFSAGCVALIVMLIRLAFRKAPKVYSYALWAVVFLRLICPFTIQLPMSAVPVQPQTIPYDIVYSENPSIQSGVPVVDHAVNTVIQSALLPASPANSVNPVQAALVLGSYFWLAGVFVLLLYGVLSCLHLKKRVRTAIRVYDNVYETDLIKTPFVLGFFRPRIYIPTGLGGKELEYVLEHERVHIRRLDYLIKPAAFLTAAVHWFNPIVWVAYALMARDMELSADERVIMYYGGDIRGHYSSSLLALSVKNSGFLSPLAFGETGVRARIRNVLRFKKPAFWVSVITVVVVAAVSLALLVSRPAETTPELLAEQSAASGHITQAVSEPSQAAFQTSYNKVTIEFLSENKGFKAADTVEITDPATVARIDHELMYSMTHSDETDLKNNHTNEYTIKLSNGIGGYSAGLYYDTLYNKAFIVNNGGLIESGTDFARFIDSFFENTNLSYLSEGNEAVALFGRYGWTLDYLIGTVKSKLNDITILSAYNPNAYYFAYNNELSKDIDLDMSGYANTADIDVDIYRIYESMPEEFFPIQNCRGIVVKSGGKIIGAFISAGRHSAFSACSLKGNGFEAAAGRRLDVWLTERIKPGTAEEKLSRLEPEQIIEEYFTALENKDAQTSACCLSRKRLLENLATNMPNGELFNEGIGLPLTSLVNGGKSGFDNLLSASLLEVKLINEPEDNVKVFAVIVNLEYGTEVSIESGEQGWDCYMVYESPQTGWKIEGFGHG